MPKKDHPEHPKIYYGGVKFEQIVPHIHSLVRQGKFKEAKEFEEGVMLEIKKAEKMIIGIRKILKDKYSV